MIANMVLNKRCTCTIIIVRSVNFTNTITSSLLDTYFPINYNWCGILEKETIVAMRSTRSPCHQFSLTIINGQPQLELAQPSTTINDFDDSIIFYMLDYDKIYDRPMGYTCGEDQCVCFNDDEYECKKNLIKWK